MREERSLDGIWKVRLDEEAELSRELRVPMPWQAADPALREHAGVVWYRREVEVPDAWRDDDVLVRFGAVDYRATLYANGREMGGHEGGYTPFEVEIPHGTRELTLRVEDPADLSEVPHGKQGGRWYTRVSGPWQSVALLRRPRQRVERVWVYPDVPRGLVRARVSCHGLAGAGATARLVVELLDAPGGQPIVGATAEAIAAADLAVLVEIAVPSPRLWSPDDPHRYALRVTMRVDGAVTDVLEEPFGLRSFETREGRLFLNGEPFYMRGALDQGYWPDGLYTVPSDEEIEREIRLAKEMGLNLLRKHIKPEDPRYLDACDRLGMLIWAEPANPDRFTEAAREATRRDLLEMVARDFNRPSVVVWSLYNEDWGVPGLFHDPAQQEWVAGLYRELKALDPIRLVCDNSGWAHVATDLNDYHEYYAAPERLERFAARLDYLVAHPEENFVLGREPTGHEAILVSEWGNWGLSDPARMGDRHWLELNGDFPAEGMKRVGGFAERFRELGLAKQFGSPAGLCEHLQRRAFRALAAQLGEMRRRPEIQGHVVTELTDIEWEGNGWLDYWRRPKLFHEWLGSINGPVALIATAARHGYWCGETVVVDLHVHNTTASALDGVVRWRLGERGGEVPAAVGPFAHADPPGVRFAAPSFAGSERLGLELELVVGGEARARTRVDLAFAPLDLARSGGRVGVVGLDRLFRQRLERFGHDTRGDWRTAPLVLASELNEDVRAHLRGGGRVLYMGAAALPSFPLPPGESWRMASGAAWADVARLAPAPVFCELGHESAGFFPHHVLLTQPGDEVLAGWLEGWLANTSALALVRAEGKGRLVATTFRFEDTYGVDPVATLLLERLLEIAAEA